MQTGIVSETAVLHGKAAAELPTRALPLFITRSV